MRYVTKFLYKFGHYLSIALMLVFIGWTYIEPNFYSNYINGELYLIWSCYFLPWVIIAANVIWMVREWKS